MSDQNASLIIRVGTSGVGAAMSELRSLAGEITGMMKSLAAPLLAGGGLLGIGEAVESVIHLGAQLQDLSDMTGASVKSLTAVDLAMQRIGMSAEDSASLITKMQRAISETVSPLSGSSQDSRYGAAFSALGLDAKQLSGMAADQQLLAIGEALTKVANDAQRADLAMAIFGRSGAQMLSVFRDPVAMKLLQGGGGTFGDVMQRDAGTDKNIQAQFAMIPYYFKEATAGLMDMLPLGEMSARLQSVFDSIDFTRAGQRAGAFVGVVIEAWRNGQFPEMLGLLVEAGFELGEIAVQKSWLALWRGLTGATSGEIMLALTDAVMSFGVGSAKFLIDVLTGPIIYMGAGFDWLGDHFREVFENVLNWFIGKFDSVMQSSAMNLVLPGAKLASIPKIQDVQPADSFSFDVAKMQAFATPAASSITNYLTQQLQASRDILGINQKLSATDNVRADAMARLVALMDEYQTRVTNNHGATPAAGGSHGNEVVPFNAKGFLEQEELAAKNALLEKEQQLAQVEDDFTKTSAEKWDEKNKILKEEQAILQRIIDLNNKLAAAPGTDAQTKQLIGQKNQTYEGQLGGVNDKLAKMGPDPNSFVQQFAGAVTKIQDQWGTFATQTASTFHGAFDTAVKSVSKGITGLIEGTMTWKKALLDIGSSVVNDIIEGVVQMGVRWVMTQTMMAVMGKSLLAASAATTAPMAALQASIWAPAATLSTIATYGASAAAAPAEIFAAQAASLGGGFAEGGYTGDGNKYDVAGVVHRGEYVMPADVVSRVGLSTLEAMRAGATGAGGSTIVQGHKVNLHFYDERPHPRDWANSSEGENWLVNTSRKNRKKIGIGT